MLLKWFQNSIANSTVPGGFGRNERIKNMFSAKHLKDMMDAKPFQPFRVHLSDGKAYEVPNHDSAFVKRNEIEIGLELDKDGIMGRSVRCAILHITQIEQLQIA